MKNVWANFFELARLRWNLSRNSKESAWKNAILHSGRGRQRNPMLCLLALSWYEATHDEKHMEPLVTSPKDAQNSVYVVSRKLGFSYQMFTNSREALRNSFEMLRDDLGFRLLHTTTYQYIRTIHRYSGVVFLKTAEHARKLTPSKWLVGEEYQELNHLLAEVAARYADGEEKEELIADVRDFWSRMAKRYRLYNAAPSLERCAAEEGDIPVSVLAKILQVLWPEQEGKDEVVHDSVPVFQLDVRGRPALGLPNNPRFSASENVNLICFVCTDKEENLLKSIRFHFADGVWHAGKEGDSVPLASVGKIVRKEFEVKTGENPICRAEQDVTPAALADSEYILFSERNGQIKPIDIETSLNIGQRYLVVPLSSEMPLIQSLDDNEQALLLRTDAVGSFAVPNDAASIQIGEDQYSVKTDIADWVDLDRRFQNVKNPSSRLFFTQGTHLLTDSCIEKDNIGVRYRRSEGDVVELPELARGEVPAEILWERGKLEIYDINTQDRVASRATTFLPDIDTRELATAMELQDVDPVHVTIGEAQIEVAIPDWSDQVEFSHQGVAFRFPLQRKGITMKLLTKDDLVELQSHGKHLKMQPARVARDDFASAVFSFLLPDEQRENGALKVNRETRESLIARFKPIPKRLRGSEILPIVALNLREDNSECFFSTWSLDGSTTVGDIILYSPEQEGVCQIRDGADLICKLPIAWRWSQRQLILVCFPGHRLDEQPIIVDADNEVNCETQAGMDLMITLRFSSFFARQDVDWGPGLHAFIARRDKTRSEGMATITPMFHIYRPAELGEWDGNCADGDPFGLRKAMAQNELAAIDEIMQSDDEECRGYVRRFEARTFTAWNSINCVKSCPAYKKGYFFMADWWLHEKAMTSSQEAFVGRMNENYRRLWSPLLTTIVPKEQLEIIQKYDSTVLWTNAHQFNEDNGREAQNKLKDLISDVEYYIKDVAPHFHTSQAKSASIFNPEINGVSRDTPIGYTRYNQYDLEKCLTRLGLAVALWRRNPTCARAQPLRDLLFRVEDLDNMISIIAPSVGPNGRPNRFGLTERIALKAWVLRDPQTI